MGLAVLTGTAFSQQIRGIGGLPGFIIGTLLIGAGIGAVRPNMSVFISEYEFGCVAMKDAYGA
jgi:POT family proton-dependent oligopeptide transporter